jgi:hypothetical protein
MIQLQKAIRDTLQDEFNKNTQGLHFEVSLYNVKSNDLLENTERIENTYATEQKRFIPVVIEDISGEYADLQNVTTTNATINMSLLIPTDEMDYNNIVVEETFEKVGIALDELRQRLQAETLPLGKRLTLIGENYELGIKSNSPKFIDIYATFPDESDGMIIENDVMSLEKDGNSIKLTLNNVSESISYDVDKEYKITIEKDGNELILSLNEFSKTIDNQTTFDYSDDFTFGGALMRVRKVELYDDPNNKIIVINDLKTFEGTSLSDITITNAKYPIEVGSIGSMTLGFSIPNPTTNQVTFGNGLNYQVFQLDLTAFITDNVFVGNVVEYYIDDVRIFPIYRDEPFVSETDASQVIGEQITKHTATQSVLSREYTVFLKEDRKLLKLAQKITREDPDPNELFAFKIVYPLFEREYVMILTQGALGITNNQPISISFKLDLASTAIQ